jgi:phosphatidylglycerophosphate synthase
MLTTRYKQSIDLALKPLASLLAACGLSPNALTLAAPVAGSLICLWFVRSREIVPFCIAITLAGCLDALDGALARATGRVTKFGAYLDAISDRYFEAIVVITVAWVTGYWLLSMAVLAGALLVSYAKARAALEVPVSNLEWPDLMERTERDALFIVGLAASAILPWKPLGYDLFWWTLLVLAALIHVTVVQRVLRARRYILSRRS